MKPRSRCGSGRGGVGAVGAAAVGAGGGAVAEGVTAAGVRTGSDGALFCLDVLRRPVPRRRRVVRSTRRARPRAAFLAGCKDLLRGGADVWVASVRSLSEAPEKSTKPEAAVNKMAASAWRIVTPHRWTWSVTRGRASSGTREADSELMDAQAAISPGRANDMPKRASVDGKSPRGLAPNYGQAVRHRPATRASLRLDAITAFAASRIPLVAARLRAHRPERSGRSLCVHAKAALAQQFRARAALRGYIL